VKSFAIEASILIDQLSSCIEVGSIEVNSHENSPDFKIVELVLMVPSQLQYS